MNRYQIQRCPWGGSSWFESQASGPLGDLGQLVVLVLILFCSAPLDVTGSCFALREWILTPGRLLTCLFRRLTRGVFCLFIEESSTPRCIHNSSLSPRTWYSKSGRSSTPSSCISGSNIPFSVSISTVRYKQWITVDVFIITVLYMTKQSSLL